MGRQRFDHLVAELSLAAGAPMPRFALWLKLRDAGLDPEGLSQRDVLAFCEGALTTFLADRGLVLSPRTLRRLRRTLSRFDPTLPRPDEQLVEG